MVCDYRRADCVWATPPWIATRHTSSAANINSWHLIAAAKKPSTDAVALPFRIAPLHATTAWFHWQFPHTRGNWDEGLVLGQRQYSTVTRSGAFLRYCKALGIDLMPRTPTFVGTPKSQNVVSPDTHSAHLWKSVLLRRRYVCWMLSKGTSLCIALLGNPTNHHWELLCLTLWTAETLGQQVHHEMKLNCLRSKCCLVHKCLHIVKRNCSIHAGFWLKQPTSCSCTFSCSKVQDLGTCRFCLVDCTWVNAAILWTIWVEYHETKTKNWQESTIWQTLSHIQG